MESKNNYIKLFYIFPFGVIFNMILGWEYFAYYTPDSYGYIQIAEELPDIKTNIFPIFYPILLRMAAFIFDNYDLAAKCLNITLVIFLFAFVKYKNFYWKELWVFFTFSSLQSIYPMVWSETILLILIIFYSYNGFKFLTKHTSARKFIIINSVLLLLMFVTKYNAMFFLGANFIFVISLIVICKKEKAISYLIATIISLILFSSYLIFNYFAVGSFMGKRGMSNDFNYIHYFFISLKNIPLTYDPFSISIQRLAIALKVRYGWTYVTVMPYVISYIITIILIFKYYRIKNKKFDIVVLFFIINSIIFLFLTFFSSYFTRIDIIDARLLLPFYLFLMISIIHFTHINRINFKNKYLFILGAISLVIYTINLIFCYFL